MGRKSSNSADYFLHYIGDGKTLYILQERWGNDGYAFWFKLLELLTHAEGHFLDLKEPSIQDYFRAKMRVSDDIRAEIMDQLVRLKKIDEELWLNHQVIWYQNLVDRLAETLYKKRNHPAPQKPCFNGNISGEKTPLQEDSRGENPLKTHHSGEKTPIISPEIKSQLVSQSVREREREDASHNIFSPEINPEGGPEEKQEDVITRELKKINPPLPLMTPAEEESAYAFGVERGPRFVDVVRYRNKFQPGKRISYHIADYDIWEKKTPRAPPLKVVCAECGYANGRHKSGCTLEPAPPPVPPPEPNSAFLRDRPDLLAADSAPSEEPPQAEGGIDDIPF